MIVSTLHFRFFFCELHRNINKATQLIFKGCWFKIHVSCLCKHQRNCTPLAESKEQPTAAVQVWKMTRKFLLLVPKVRSEPQGWCTLIYLLHSEKMHVLWLECCGWSVDSKMWMCCWGFITFPCVEIKYFIKRFLFFYFLPPLCLLRSQPTGGVWFTLCPTPQSRENRRGWEWPPRLTSS